MANDLISVIIPVFNSDLFLEEAIRSVISQTYTFWELLLIDDGSTDESGNICDKFSQIDSRIHVVHQNNKGVSAARNTGLKNANGSYICFLDSDDYLYPDFLEVLLSSFCDNTSLAVCTLRNEKNNSSIHLANSKVVYSNVAELKESFSDLYFGGFFNSPTNKLYKRIFVTSIFPENMSLGEDLIFNINYLKNLQGDIVLLPNELYFYRTTVVNSLSKRLNRDIGLSWKAMIESFDTLFDHDDIVNSIVAKRCVETINFKIINYIAQGAKRNEYKPIIDDIALSGLSDCVLKTNIKLKIKDRIVWKCIISKNDYLLKMLCHFYKIAKAAKGHN